MACCVCTSRFRRYVLPSSRTVHGNWSVVRTNYSFSLYVQTAQRTKLRDSELINLTFVGRTGFGLPSSPVSISTANIFLSTFNTQFTHTANNSKSPPESRNYSHQPFNTQFIQTIHLQLQTSIVGKQMYDTFKVIKSNQCHKLIISVVQMYLL